VFNSVHDEPLELHAVLSDSLQFYPTRFQPTTVAPGAAHTLTVAFLPRTLGEAMATLLLRTSLGGFVLQMRGEGVQSQYQLTPVRGAKVRPLFSPAGSRSLYARKWCLQIRTVLVWRHPDIRGATVAPRTPSSKRATRVHPRRPPGVDAGGRGGSPNKDCPYLETPLPIQLQQAAHGGMRDGLDERA
jgi:hypothetical protein